MAGDRTLDQEEILFGQYFENAEVFHLDAAAAVATGHAHTFHYLGGVRRSADRTGGSEAVVLAVSRFAYPAEAVAFHNALETFTFGDAYGANLVAFGKYLVNADSIAELFIQAVEIAELNNFAFGVGPCFLEMPLERFWRIFGLRFAEAQLEGFVAVCVFRFYLGNDTGPCFDNGAGHATTSGIIDAGHADLLTD